jgi:Bacterial capsule synthesis protein PGA_cap
LTFVFFKKETISHPKPPDHPFIQQILPDWQAPEKACRTHYTNMFLSAITKRKHIRDEVIDPSEFDTPVRTFASGYNWREKLAFIKNRIRPSYAYQDLTKPLSQKNVVNQGVAPVASLGFLGDVMPIKDMRLHIMPDVVRFFADVDYLFVNLEGIVTRQQRMLALSHHPRIIDDLHQFFPAQKIILYVANNHVGDFGYRAFDDQYHWLKNRFGAVIGAHNDAATTLLDGRLNVVAATGLSNQVCRYVSWLDDAHKWHRPDAQFNLLLPHWGYEMQLYPHPQQIQQAQNWLQNWNLLVGNHSHCVQPVAAYDVHAERRAVVYSMGNFCYHHRWPHHRFGKIVKVEIGPNEAGTWQTGTLEWAFTKHAVGQHRELRVHTVERVVY